MVPEPPTERDDVLAQVREEYARRSARADRFGEARRRSDLQTWLRTMRAYERMLDRHGLLPLAERRLLDVGSGRNEFLVKCRADWGHRGDGLCGIDLMPDRVEQGQRDFPYLQLVCGSGDELPWPDDSFDLVHQSMVHTSVLDEPLRHRINAEMARVTRPGGFILWYDFIWNPVNPAARGIPLRQVRRYFPNWKMCDHRRITLAPPLTRSLGRLWDGFVGIAERLWIFNLWELVLLQKPQR